MTATVRLENIKKSYANTDVLHGIDLEIRAGEFLVVVGPSGCGKSSLLRMIAGLESITEGKLFIDALCVNRIEAKDRNIAMVFQNYALYPHMTIYKNMAYGLKMQGFDKHEIKARIDETASILKIEKLLDRKPAQLSGGQRQRVAMGRAIVRHPKVFLFDEPLSNLDAKLRMEMRIEIKKLQNKLGTTSIYVTHDQVEAMTLADRIMVLNEGCIEQVGTPEEIYQRPESMFVANFMGMPAMNMIPSSSMGQFPEIDFGGIIKPVVHKQHIDPEACTVGIRAEDVHLKPLEQAIKFKVTINLIESLGADKWVYTVLDDNCTSFNFRVSNNFACVEGQKVMVWVKKNDIHIFDENTTQRLN